MQRSIEEDGSTSGIEGVIPIAGDFVHQGRPLDAVWEEVERRPKKDDDGDKKEGGEEGLKVVLHGGQYLFENGRRKQTAVVEFVCDRERTGLEGLVKGEEALEVFEEEEEEGDNGGEDNGGEDEGDKPGHEDGDDDGDDGKDDKKSLRFISYGPSTSKGEENTDTLRLQWRTKHACRASDEQKEKPKPNPSSKHWGFFTWLVIMYVLFQPSQKPLFFPLHSTFGHIRELIVGFYDDDEKCLLGNSDLSHLWLVVEL